MSDKKFYVFINGKEVEVSEEDYKYINCMNDGDWM